MAEFDPTQFQKVIADRLDKVQAIQRASAEKAQKLGAFIAVTEDQYAQTRQANEESWVGQLGLDPNDVTARALNLGANVIEGGVNIAKNLVVAAPVGGAAFLDQSVPDQVKDARARQLAGTADADDLALLASPVPMADANRKLANVPSQRQQQMLADGTAETYQKRIEKIENALATAKGIRDTMDVSSIVHRADQRAMEQDLRSGYQTNADQIARGWNEGGVTGAGDIVSGLGGLFATIGGAAVSNPQASLEFIAANAPQLAAALYGGAPGMALTNLPYAVDEFGKGIAEYQKNNGGALPPDAELQKMGAYAASLALAETVGDKLTLGAGKVGKAAAGSTDATRRAFKSAILNNGATRTAAAGLGGGAGEFVTEGYQTFAENEIQGKETTGEDMFVGGSIGAIAGGGTSMGLRAAGEITQTTPEAAAKAIEKAEKAAARQAEKVVQETAVSTGKVDELLDPTKPTYSPAGAIRALYGNSQLETTTVEAKEANYTKAGDILFALEEQRETVEAKLKDDTLRAEDKAPLQRERTRVIKALDAAMAEFDNFSVEQVKDVDLDAEVAAVSSNTPEAATAAERVINLSMAVPERLDTDTALKLANDSGNALTEGQRAYLRQFAAARVEENKLKTMGGVSAEVLNGSAPDSPRTYVGISQYRARVAQALNAGNVPLADKHLANLKSFAADHADKAIVARNAFEIGGGTQIIRTAEGVWDTNNGARMSDKAIRENGGLTLNSLKLVERIEVEAAALAQAVTELETAKAVKLGTAVPNSTAGGSNVTNQPQGQAQQSPAASGQSTVQAQEKAPASRSDAAPAATGQAGTPGDSIPVAKKETLGQTVTRYTEYLRNPPADFTTDRARDIAAWAKPRLERATEVLKTVDPSDLDTVTKYEDLKIDLDQLIKKANEIVDADTALEQSMNPTEPTKDEVKPEPSKLDVFKNKVAGAIDYIKRNLVADFFTQSAGREGVSSKRPLAAVKNLLSKWTDGSVNILDYLDRKGDGLLDAEDTAIKDLKKHLDKWVPLFQKNLSKDGRVDSPFLSEDMMQYLLQDGDTGLDIEENVKTAMAFAAYQWLVQRAQSPAKLTVEQINKMHGRDKDAYIDPAGIARLAPMSGFENAIIADLGATALQALGLKLGKNAPQDLLPRMESALGTHVLAMMEREGLLQREPIKAADIKKYFTVANEESAIDPGTQGKIDFSSTAYVSVVRNDALKAIGDSNAGSGNVIERLFGVEFAPRMADLKPAKFDQKFAKNTKQAISKAQVKAIQDVMNTPHKAIPEMLALAFGIGRANVLRVAGHVDLEGGKFHKVNRDSIEAQNQNLEHQYDLMMEMLDDPRNPEGYDTEFYVRGEVWKNYRAGFTTQSLNQQTSKIHRYLFARPNWTAQVELDNAAHIEELMISLAQAFGIAVDKQRNEGTLAKFDAEKAKDPKIMQAVAAAQKLESDGSVELTPAEIELITSVAESREGMMTLQAIMAYAKYEKARAKGDKTVDITMLVGADGKTSGPMLTHLALGAGDSVDALYDVLNRGGMYSTDEGQPDHFGQYYEADDSMDLYESLATNIIAVAKNYRTTVAQIKALRQAGKHKEASKLHTQEVWNAMEVITGQLEQDGKASKSGRNLVKTPLTAFGFGSSLPSAIISMENKFIENLYATIEGIAQGKKGAPTLEAFYDALDALIVYGDYKHATLPRVAIDKLLDTQLPESAEAAIRKAFNRAMGVPVKDSMQTYFATFIDRRTDLNKTIQASFEIYQMAYQDARIKEIERMIESGEIAHRVDKNGNKVPLHDMTEAQEDAFRAKFDKLLPIMHNEYSRAEGNLDAGLYMAKTKQGQTGLGMHHSKVRLGQGITNSEGKQSGWLQSDGITRLEESPGVAGAAYAIHSLDSANMHMAMNEVPQSMNVHDEIGNGVTTISTAAQAINKATALNMLNYSPAREAADMFGSLVIELAKRVASGEVAREQLQSLYEAWRVGYNRGLPKEAQVAADDLGTMADRMVQLTHLNALNADSVRLGVVAKMKSMDQYPWEGGQFYVTDEIREQAAAMLKALPKTPGKKLLEAVAYLNNVQKATTGQTATVPDWAKRTDEQAEPEAVEALTEAEAMQALGIAGPVGATVKVELGQDASIQKLADTAQQIPAALTTPWGMLGTPRMGSNPKLVAFFEANPNPTVQEVLSFLNTGLASGAGWQKDFAQKLVQVLGKTIDKNLRIRYVTPDTPADAVLEAPLSKSRGWYVSNAAGAQEIYVLSPAFEDSGLTVELLLHEITHGALARIIAAEQGNTGSDAAKLIHELDQLRMAARMTTTEANRKKYAEALNDIQEFVSYGMTNLEFQKDVLSGLKFKSNTAQNRFVAGMQKFIDTLVGILFRRNDRALSSGMTALVANVSGLFYAAAEKQSLVAAHINQSMAAAGLMDYTALDIHRALDDGSVSADFQVKLGNLLSGIVTKLHGATGSLADTLMKDQAIGPMDVWQKALTTGAAPFASQVLAHIRTSPQEAFAIEQVEATVRAALAGNEAYSKMAYAELSKLYDEARAKLKPADFASRDEYEFFFRIEKTAGDRSDYLARFAAVGLAHERINGLLGFGTAVRAPNQPTGFGDRLQAWFEKVLAWLTQRVTGTFAGQQANTKLEALVEQLASIEERRRHTLLRKKTALDILAPVEKGVADGVEMVRQKVVDLAGADWVRDSASGFVAGGGTILRTIAGNRVDQYMDALKDYRTKSITNRNTLAGSLINEYTGPLERFQALLRMSKNNERIRKGIITNTAKTALESFANKGKGLSEAAKAGLTAAFLRTGLHTLTGDFTMQQLQGLVEDKADRAKAMAKYEAELTGFGNLKAYFINQANALGYYKATGRVRSPNLMMNAHNIAGLYGTAYRGRMTQAQVAQATPIIEKLVALYALDYLSAQQRDAAAEVIDAENQRKDGNGVEFLLRLHQRLEAESKDRLFAGKPSLMMHGYTPEILNPHVEIKIASVTPRVDAQGNRIPSEGEILELQGYTKGAAVTEDRANPDKEAKHIYVLKDGGLQPYLSGVMSYTGKQAKGSKMHNGWMNVNTVSGLENAQLHATIMNNKGAAVRSLFTGSRQDLSQSTDNHLAPVVNNRGDVVNYRYLMAEHTKDNLLDRDNRFEKILGTLAGSIFDKESTQSQNKDALVALRDQYEAEYATQKEAYVLVGPKSADPELREIWDMLPDDTKSDARKVFGRDGIWVRGDSLDIMFGYRKLSLAQLFDKEPALRKGWENVVTGVVEWALSNYARVKLGMNPGDAEEYAKRAAVLVRKGENIWQEIVRETKDIFVVKSGVVMLGNIWSNLSLLAMSGVSIKDTLHHHLVAMKGATAYQRDSTELARLQTLRDTGYPYVDPAEVDRQILRLEDAIARNPVKELIDAGLMPTIVEDIAADDDIYSYKSAFVRRMDRYTSKLNPQVLNVAKTVYMAHDTKMYQGLTRITQLSDFVARYTLYQHLTTRKIDPLSKADAVQEASEAFVNYDIPMHRGLQYTDDMGVTMFTKYFLRIQRVLLKLARDNPARVFLTILLNNYLELGPIVLDSSAVAKIGNNPLHLGALQFPGALDELGTVSAGLALVK